MLVRMLVGLSGPAILLQPGGEADFPSDEAIRLIDAGFAVPVATQQQQVERAVRAQAPERRGKKKRDVVSGD
jgi:hypothetical protein